MYRLSYLILFLNFHIYTEGQITFRVVDENDNGIRSEIVIIDSKNQENRIGFTDINGIFKCKCKDPEIVQAKPLESFEYFPSEKTPCTDLKKTIKVQKILHVNNLRANFMMYADDKPGTAAFISSELAFRYKSIDRDSAEYYKTQTLLLAAMRLGVESPFVQDSSHIKISDAFLNAIKALQKRSNLPTNGQLDYLTMKALTEEKKPIAHYIF